MIEDLIRKTRSCRRFFGDHPISMETLRKLVDLARLSASGGNLQPLKYILSNEKHLNNAIFANLSWAAYLKDWDGPEVGERPSGYIIVLGDRQIIKTFGCDHGIASQSILLGATTVGLAGCIIGSVNRDNLRKQLQIPHRYSILLVIALGRPKEDIVIESVGPANTGGIDPDCIMCPSGLWTKSLLSFPSPDSSIPWAKVWNLYEPCRAFISCRGLGGLIDPNEATKAIQTYLNFSHFRESRIEK
jgi:nitroreductase